MQNPNQITETSQINLREENKVLYTDSEMVEANVQLNLQIDQMVNSLIESAQEICKLIEKKSEPVHLIEMLNQSLQSSHQALQQYFSQGENLQKKKEFYQKVFKAVTDKMLNEKLLQSEFYLPQILRFFRNVLVNFFPSDIQDENICEVVHQIFNLDSFLYTQALQQSQRKVGQNENGDGAESLEQQRIKSENAWRITLKVGDRVDGIKLKHQQQYRIKGWSRGSIIRFINEDPDTLLIQFDNEPIQNSLTTNRYSGQIAPEGTFTDDIAWRDEIQKGTEIDCLDSENVWYKSTILDTRSVNAGEEQEIKQVYVGFRIYNEEEGHKIDDDGRKYIGWSNRYDEWRNLQCVTVQKLATISKHYKIAGRQHMNYDMTVDDLTDTIYNNQERKIWAIYRPNFFANLRCIADYLNEFGMRGGFENILKFFNSIDPSRKVSLKHIQFLIDFLAKGQPLWHRQFACNYIPLLRVCFEKAILTTNNANNGPLQLSFLKETMVSCQKSFQTILKRVYTMDQQSYFMNILTLQIGFSLLNSDKLEKRIQGIKEIAEQIKNIRFQMKKAISNQEIIEFLKRENFCEKIFGENYHIQLIQRSADIIKFMFLEKSFGQKELEYLWQAGLKDQQTKIEIYKVIQETSGNYSPDEKDYLLDRFAQIPAEEFGEKEVECVYELTKFIYKQSPQSLKAANLFWSIATREKDYKKQLTEVAIDKFIDITRNWDRQDKAEYPLKCIEIIKDKNIQSAIPAIKILLKMIDNIPTFKQQNIQNQAEFAQFLVDEFKLFDLIVEELNVYQKSANELWSKNIINKDNIESVEILDQSYNHRSQMTLRLNFFRQLKSQISIDSEIFFWWFKTILNDQNKISQEVMDHFFREKICSKEVKFTNIKRFGFECIQSMFLQINDYNDKLVINSSQNQMGGNQNFNMNSNQNINNQNNNNNAVKIEFKIHVHPHELEGIDVVWRMLEDIDKKSVDIVPQIIVLITKVYLNLSSMMEDQIHKIGEDFTQECLSRFSKIAQNQAATFEEKQQLVKYLVTMMKSFFEDSEKNGTGGLKPHLSLDKGDFYQKIIINNNITSMKSCPKYIEINTYSNMTFWELKKIVAAKTKTSPLKITLGRSDNQKRQLTDNDNIKLLKDLKLDSYEVLSAQKKSHVGYIQKAAILNKKKQLVPEAKKIFTSWFKTFSDETNFMTPDTCAEFVKSSTNDPNVTATDSRVTKLFDEYDKDLDGKLSIAEFLEFYRDKASTRVELVWSNLTAHNIGPDLRPISHNFSYDDDINELKDKTLLARYKLSNSQSQFQQLFEFLENGYEEIWTLLTNLRTNQTIYGQVLTQDDLLLNLDKQSIYKQLYSLQIIEDFVNEHQLSQDQHIKNYFNDNNINDYPSLPSENAGPQSGHNNNNGSHSNINVNKIDHIPDAPVMSIGPMLPPNLNNTSNQNGKRDKIFDTLENFPGQIIVEELQSNMFSAEEIQQILAESGVQVENLAEYKKEWLAKFLQKGGLELLINMLKNILDSSEHKKQEDVLKSKYEKELVNTLLKIIKIIVMSTFCAQSQNQELTIQLQRRISQNAEELQASPQQQKQDQSSQENQQVQIDTSTNQQDKNSQQQNDKKSKIQTDQEATAQIFIPLINLLKGSLGQNIFNNLNFESFQQLVLNLILIILHKDKQISMDDRSIIDQALSLWISLLVFNPQLLLQLQQKYKQRQSDIEQNKEQQLVVTILIEKGLLCWNNPLRTVFKEAFLFIAKQVKVSDQIEAPQFYLLRQLLSQLNSVLEKSAVTGQFFDLLKQLLAMYFQTRDQSPETFTHIFDSQQLLVEVIQELHKYKSNERKAAYYSEDYNLTGMIYIINMIILNNQQLLTEQQNQELLQEIVERLLFSFNITSYQHHITKEIKLDEIEKPQLNKCLSAYSRTAAYNLLNTVCLQNPQFIGEVISRYWFPLISNIKKPKKQGQAPKLDNRAGNGFVGIRNLGCICYMNSMIQQFFNVPAFRYGILSADDKQPLKLKEFEGDQVDDNLLHQLMKYMSFLELSERQDYNPREFCFAFKDFDNNPTNVRIQQDAQEFLNVLFDRVEYSLKNTSQKYLLQNIFGGKTCSLMICKSCGNLKQREEDFNNITIEVKNQKSVYEGLKKFTAGETINDFQCEACNQRVDVEKKTVIQQLPNMLILHLQRIIFDFDTLMNAKLNSRVEFPNILNMKAFMLDEILKQEKEIMKKAKKEKKKLDKQNQNNQASNQQKKEDEKDEEDEDQSMKKSPEKKGNNEVEDTVSEDEEDENMADSEELKDENFEYKLVGVVLHMGTADAGHYVSFININRGKHPESTPEWARTEKDKWLEFNDSVVKDYAFSELEEDCFGGASSSMSATVGDFKNDYSRNAYMLIYEKRVKEKIKIVLPQELIQSNTNLNQQISQSQQTLDCDGTAISRGQATDQNINTDIPHVLYTCPQIQEQLKENKDIYFDKEKNETIAYVDFNSIQKFVPHQYYQKQPTLLQQGANSSKLYEFMEKLIFDIVSMVTDNKQLLPLVQLLIKMLEQNDSESLRFIEEKVMSFNDPKVIEAALADKKLIRGIFEMLTTNSEVNVREMGQKFLEYAVIKLFMFTQMDKVDTIIDYALSLMPEEISKNWLKMNQFFSFFLTISCQGSQFMQYLNNKGIVSRFIDFFLENESPKAKNQSKRNSMGSNYANPPFDNLITLVVTYGRNMPRIPNLDQLDFSLDYTQQLQTLFSQVPASIFFYTQHPNTYLVLSHDDVQMLQLKQFYTKALKLNCQVAQVAQLAAHVGFENFEFSHKLAKKILLGINQCNGDDIKPYLDILQPFLYLSDSIQPQRLEWILGIPYLRIEKPMTNFNMLPPNINNYKVGVSAISQMSDDIYEYRSTLFKSSNSIKESLLQILYQYRNRWNQYILQALQTLLNISYQDPQHRLLMYMYKLEPPTYSYARYVDWIRPYLQETIVKATRTRHLMSSQVEISLATNVNLILSKQLQDIATMLNPPPQQQQQQEQQQEQQQINEQQQEEQKQVQEQEQQPIGKYITYDSSRDGGPEQYLIWNLQSEKLIETKEYPDNIVLNVYQYDAFVSESKPTSNGNLILNNYKKQNNNYNNNNQMFKVHQTNGRGANWNNAGHINGNPYGRGVNSKQYVETNNQSIGKRRGRKNDQNRGTKKLKGKKVIQENPQSEQDVVYGQQTAEEYSATGGGAVSDVQMADDENDRQNNRYNQNNGEEGEYEDDEIDSYENTNEGTMNSQYQDLEQFQDDKFIQDDTNMNQDNNAQQDQDEPQQQPSMQGVQSSVPDIQRKESDNSDYWTMSTVAVLLFQVTNNDVMRNQKVTLTFQDLSENGQSLNFRVPATPIPCQVNSNKERDIAIFTKLRIFDDWGNFSYDLKVEQQKNKGMNMSIQMNNNNNNNNSSNTYMSGPYEPQQSSDLPTNNGGVGTSNSDVKECGTCTYHNPLSYTICSMCGSPLKW